MSAPNERKPIIEHDDSAIERVETSGEMSQTTINVCRCDTRANASEGTSQCSTNTVHTNSGMCQPEQFNNSGVLGRSKDQRISETDGEGRVMMCDRSTNTARERAVNFDEGTLIHVENNDGSSVSDVVTDKRTTVNSAEELTTQITAVETSRDCSLPEEMPDVAPSVDINRNDSTVDGQDRFCEADTCANSDLNSKNDIGNSCEQEISVKTRVRVVNFDESTFNHKECSLDGESSMLCLSDKAGNTHNSSPPTDVNADVDDNCTDEGSRGAESCTVGVGASEHVAEPETMMNSHKCPDREDSEILQNAGPSDCSETSCDIKENTITMTAVSYDLDGLVADNGVKPFYSDPQTICYNYDAPGQMLRTDSNYGADTMEMCEDVMSHTDNGENNCRTQDGADISNSSDTGLIECMCQTDGQIMQKSMVNGAKSDCECDNSDADMNDHSGECSANDKFTANETPLVSHTPGVNEHTNSLILNCAKYPSNLEEGSNVQKESLCNFLPYDGEEEGSPGVARYSDVQDSGEVEPEGGDIDGAIRDIELRVPQLDASQEADHIDKPNKQTQVTADCIREECTPETGVIFDHRKNTNIHETNEDICNRNDCSTDTRALENDRETCDEEHNADSDTDSGQTEPRDTDCIRHIQKSISAENMQRTGQLTASRVGSICSQCCLQNDRIRDDISISNILTVAASDISGLTHIRKSPARVLVAPDGGWGWVVLAASTVVMLMLPSLIKSYGIILESVCEQLEVDQSTASWIPAICYFVYNFMGVVSGSMCQRYSYRAVSTAGIVIGSLGFLVAFIAPNIHLMYVGLGVMVGCGACFVYCCAVLAVGQYFERYRGLATGLCVSGSALGGVIFPPIIAHQLDLYGFRWTMLMMFGITVCGLPFSLLYQPVERHMVSVNRHEQQPPTAPLSAVTSILTLLQRHRQKPGTAAASTVTATNTLFSHLSAPQCRLCSRRLLAPSSCPMSTGVNTASRQTSQPLCNECGLAGTESTRQTVDASQNMSENGGDGSSVWSVNALSGCPCCDSGMELNTNCEPSTIAAQPAKRQSTPTSAQSNLEQCSIACDGTSVPQVSEAFTWCHHQTLTCYRWQRVNCLGASTSNERSDRPADDTASVQQRCQRCSAKIQAEMTGRQQPCWSERTSVTLQHFAPDVAPSLLSVRTLRSVAASAVASRKRAAPPETIDKTDQPLLDLSLLKNPVFLVIATSCALYQITSWNLYIVLPLYASQSEFTASQSSLLLSALSASDLVGRMTGAVVADRFPAHRLLLAAYVISGLALAALPTMALLWWRWRVLFVTISALVFGVAAGISVSTTSMVLIQRLGVDLLANSFGLCVCVSGLVLLLTPPAISRLQLAVSSAAVVVYILSLIPLMAASVWLLMPRHHQ